MPFQIVKKEQLSDNMFRVTFHAPLVARRAQPGQFLMFRVDELSELKHLNICWNRKLADISPIYGLDLERLWIGCLTQVPKEQIDKYRELHPDCIVNDEVLDSHTDWRWDKDRNYYPRYALLRQQLGYHYPEGGTDYVFY